MVTVSPEVLLRADVGKSGSVGGKVWPGADAGRKVLPANVKGKV